MLYEVVTEGTESFEMAKGYVRKVTFTADIPLDANARTKDAGSTPIIIGRISITVGGDSPDSTRKMAIWLSIPAEKPDCYRKVMVEYVATDVVERRCYFPDMFVIDYKEDFGDAESTGTFMPVIKQKEDRSGPITIEGGYSATQSCVKTCSGTENGHALISVKQI